MAGGQPAQGWDHNPPSPSSSQPPPSSAPRLLPVPYPLPTSKSPVASADADACSSGSRLLINNGSSYWLHSASTDIVLTSCRSLITVHSNYSSFFMEKEGCSTPTRTQHPGGVWGINLHEQWWGSSSTAI
ncbi:hypothetical protein T439DRAFT_118861 [Meredithblackwellia eburnea MCA 4105]